MQQRFYSHRKFRNVLVNTLEIIQLKTNPIQLELSLNSGNNSQDFSFQKLNSSIEGTTLIQGCILITEEADSGKFLFKKNASKLLNSLL